MQETLADPRLVGNPCMSVYPQSSPMFPPSPTFAKAAVKVELVPGGHDVEVTEENKAAGPPAPGTSTTAPLPSSMFSRLVSHSPDKKR